jgi:methionyl aminopeptidase
MIIIKNKEQISGIKKASALAAKCLLHLEQYIFIGQNTLALDQLACDYMLSHHATSATLNYRGFSKSICTSINDVVCHGIPSEKDILKSGDIINVDVTVILNGYFGDTSRTYIVGEVSEETRLFVDRSEKALYKGIDVIKPGVKLSQIGKVIETYVKKFGYGIVRDYGGHGVGIAFHEEPHVHHYYEPLSSRIILREGMTFTVEPMINQSKNYQIETCEVDGWTVRTKDKALSAQFEHTVLVTASGCEILTLC